MTTWLDIAVGVFVGITTTFLFIMVWESIHMKLKMALENRKVRKRHAK